MQPARVEPRCGSKVPGGQAPSEKFLKKEAQSHNEGGAPGDAPVAGDSYTSNVGVGSHATNVSGEQGNIGQKVNERPAQ